MAIALALGLGLFLATTQQRSAPLSAPRLSLGGLVDIAAGTGASSPAASLFGLGGGGGGAPAACDLDIHQGVIAQSCRLIRDVCVDQVGLLRRRRCVEQQGCSCACCRRARCSPAAAAHACLGPPCLRLHAASGHPAWRRVQGVQRGATGVPAAQAAGPLCADPQRNGMLLGLSGAGWPAPAGRLPWCCPALHTRLPAAPAAAPRHPLRNTLGRRRRPRAITATSFRR